MKFRIAYAVLPMILLAGCGKGDAGAGAGGNVTAAPVAAAPAPAGKNWLETVAKTPEGGFVMGNPDAPIKLIEYGSRLCPTCGAFANTGMKPLEAGYIANGKVSYEFREFLVHGPPDLAPALLGRCAGIDTFFPLLEQMFAAQATIVPKFEDTTAVQAVQTKLQGQAPNVVSTGWADYLGYVDFVKQRGIPEQQARACLNDTKQIDALAAMTAKGSELGVTGTPSFFLNGRKLDAVSWTDVETALKSAGA